MTIQPLQFSIVVLGENHNPTIINPDFLALRDIVPDKWKWKRGEPIITTPPFAQVTYDNNISIQVRPNLAQFLDPRGCNPLDSEILHISKEFVKTLRHVRYSAVGFNFHYLSEMELPDEFLIKRFLKNGEWNQPQHTMCGFALRFIYPIKEEKGQITIRLDGAKANTQNDDNGEERQALLVVGNFHRDCDKYPADEQIGSFVDMISDDFEQFKELTHLIIGSNINGSPNKN